MTDSRAAAHKTTAVPTITVLWFEGNPQAYGSLTGWSVHVEGPSGAADGSVTMRHTAGGLGNGIVMGPNKALNVFGNANGAINVCCFYAGVQTFTIDYSGGGENSPASITTYLTITSGTTTTLSSNFNPAAIGQPLVVTATVSPNSPSVQFPAGTVTFKEGATVLGTSTLANGQATLSGTGLALGGHAITAVYSPAADGPFFGSTSAAFSQTVVPTWTTSTTVTSSHNPSPWTMPVTFTATVASGSTSPAPGSVTFTIDGVAQAPVTLNGGVATLTTAALSMISGEDPPHQIQASYSGGPGFHPSAGSLPTGQFIGRVSMALSIVPDVNPGYTGQPVTYTARLSVVPPGTAPLPAGGQMQFSFDGSFSNSPLVNGVSTRTFTWNTAGAHFVQAIYGGDATYNSVIGDVVNLSVLTPAATTTTITSSINPSKFGQPVTITAFVAASGVPVTLGTVRFTDGDLIVSAPTLLDATGHASVTLSNLSVGSHEMEVLYSGGTGFSGNFAGPLTEVVQKAATTTALTSSANPVGFGQTLSLTAHVAAVAPGAGAPTGTVTFTDGATTIGTAALNGSGDAVLSPSLAAGAHSITASYPGDANFTGSASSPALAQSVDKEPTNTLLTASTSTSNFGQSVTFTATVTVAGGSTPTGTVTFFDGASSLGSAPLGSGVATFSTSALAGGPHSITASYGGTATLATSTSGAVGHQVDGAAVRVSITQLFAPPFPFPQLTSNYGDNVTFLVTIYLADDSGQATGGTVVLKDGTTTIGGPTTVDGFGQARFSTSALAVGSHTIAAEYAGTANYAAGVGSTPFTVVGAPTRHAFTFQATGTTFTLTDTVTRLTTGTAVSDGAVTFTDGLGATIAGPVAVDAQGHATIAGISIIPGRTIVASYATSISNAPSTATLPKAAGIVDGGVDGPPGLPVGAGTPTVFKFVVGRSEPFPSGLSFVGAPGGTVTLSEGTTALGTATVNSSGDAFVTATLTTAGEHTLHADYSGDEADTGQSEDITVNVIAVRETPTVTVTSSVNPSVGGQSVAFTASARTGALGDVIVPDGTITFTEGSTTLQGATAVNASGDVTFTTSALSVGSHTITASYGGGSTATAGSGSVDQVVNAATATIDVSSSPNPSVTGQPVTITATVHGVAGGGAPSGTVDFKDAQPVPGTLDTITLTPVPGTNDATATLALALPFMGLQNLSAAYSGDTTYPPAASAEQPHTVNQALTSTTLESTPNPAMAGEDVTFTVTVAPVAPGAGTPTGTVVLDAGAAPLATLALQDGVASWTVHGFAARPLGYGITATYSGDASFGGSFDTLTQVVNSAATHTTLSSSATPTRFGQAVTFSANVAADFGTPTGSIAFTIDGASYQTVPLDPFGDATTFATSSLGIGAHDVRAEFVSTSGHEGSADTLTQVVNAAETRTTVVSSVNPSVYGQGSVYTATVTTVAPGGGVPTGTVAFGVDGSTIVTAPTVGGIAHTPPLFFGQKTVTATFSSGTNRYLASSGSVDQLVDKASTRVVLNVPQSSPSYGDVVQILATVNVIPPGSGATAGTVTFYDGATPIGSETLSGGLAGIATTDLAAGAHDLTAAYSGNASFNGATSDSYPLNVAAAHPTFSVSDNGHAYGVGPTNVTGTLTFAPQPPPEGDVTITVGGITADAPLAPDGAFAASIDTSALPVGSHPILFSYSGGGNYTSASATRSLEVWKADSAFSNISTPTLTFGDASGTFSGNIHGAFGGMVTGQVDFTLEGVTLASALASNGDFSATFDTATLAAGGPHTVSFHYAGDSNVNGNDTSRTFSVAKAQPAFSAIVDATATFGDATITLSGEFTENAPGAIEVNVAGFSAQAVRTGRNFTATIPIGGLGASPNYAVLYAYAGSDNFQEASASSHVAIGKATPVFSELNAPTVELGASHVTLTGRLAAPGAIPFADAFATLDGVTLAASVGADGSIAATFDAEHLAVGVRSVEWDFGGDGNFEPAHAQTHVTVQDTTRPTLNLPSDIHVNADPGSPSAVVTFSATADDNSGPVQVQCDSISQSPFFLGDTPVHCTATDPSGNTAEGTFHVFVNGPPTATVSLAPAAPKTGQTITATIGTSDPDGNTVTRSIRWLVNGSPVSGATGTTFTAPHKGDVVRIDVTPNDGTVDGPVATDSITVVNSQPTVTNVHIVEASAKTNDVLHASSTIADPDVDATTVNYQWFVNGLAQPGATGTSYDLSVAGNGNAGDLISVSATPNDGTVDGASSSSAALTVADSAPAIIIGPETPSPVQHTDVVTIQLTATDPDPGQAISFTAANLPSGVQFFDHHNGTATMLGPVFVGAGTYAPSFTVSDGTLTDTKTGTITVVPEDATATYTGPSLFSSQTVTLTASVAQAADGSTIGELASQHVDFRLIQGATIQTIPNVALTAGTLNATTTTTLGPGDWTVSVRVTPSPFFTGPYSSPVPFAIGAVVDNRRAQGDGEAGKDRKFNFDVKPKKNGVEGESSFDWTTPTGQKHKFRCKTPTSLFFLGPALNRAIFSCGGSLDGVAGFSATFDVVDNGNPGKGKDTYAIKIVGPTSYSLPATLLTSGNIQIKGKTDDDDNNNQNGNNQNGQTGNNGG